MPRKLQQLAAPLALWLTLLGGFSSLAVAQPFTDMAPETLAQTDQDALLILDVRSESEYDRGHVPGAIHIPHNDLTQRLDELDGWQQKPVVIYCETGGRARNAATLLQARGFSQVFHLDGDMREWRKSGRKIAF